MASGAEDWCILIPQVTRADPCLFLLSTEWPVVGALSTVQVLVLLGKETQALVSVSCTLLILYQSPLVHLFYIKVTFPCISGSQVR